MEDENKDQSLPAAPTVRAVKKSCKDKKTILLVVLLIALFVIALTTVDHSAPTRLSEGTAETTSSQILGWNTYTDNEIGFSIDFPSDWGIDPKSLYADSANGELNLIFCPIKNNIAKDSGGDFNGCQIDNDGSISYRDPFISLSWYPNDDPTAEVEGYGDPYGFNKLSPDKKYSYSLTRSDDRNRYSDIYDKMTASLKFIDKKSKDEIIWLEPRKLEDLKLFIPYIPDHVNNNYIKSGGKQFEPTYHLVGRINSGKYAGADIISAIFGVDGKSYTILKIDGGYKILSKYNDDFGDYDLNNWAAELRTDGAYDISSLDCPDEISPVEGITFKRTDEPENIFDPNSTETKESLLSKKIGKSLDGKDIYDLSNDGQRQEIGILLPNGTLVFYALQNIKYADNLPLVDGRILSDYVTHPFCSGAAWSKQDHNEYYEPSNLKQIGGIYGLPVYEISNTALLKKLYTDMDGGKDSPYFPAMKNLSLEAFAASHPLLIWTDPYGRRFALIDEKFDECQTIQTN